jgi:hypothetical protein
MTNIIAFSYVAQKLPALLVPHPAALLVPHHSPVEPRPATMPVLHSIPVVPRHAALLESVTNFMYLCLKRLTKDKGIKKKNCN